MPSLRKNQNGSYGSRYRIPADVRDEYKSRFGQAYEDKFYAPADTPASEAKRLFSEWIATCEGRFAGIRAERDGVGLSLTPMQARARRRVVRVVFGPTSADWPEHP